MSEENSQSKLHARRIPTQEPVLKYFEMYKKYGLVKKFTKYDNHA